MVNLHPITVHFTIALFSLAVLFQILGWLFEKESLKSAGFWNLAFALPSAIASVLTGRYAESVVPHNEVIHEVMETHETIGYIVLAVITLLFIWRFMAHRSYIKRTPALFAVAGMIGLGVMSVGAYHGGELVFTHGAGVVPMMEILAEEPHDHAAHGSPEGANSASEDIEHEDVHEEKAASEDEHDHGSHDH